MGELPDLDEPISLYPLDGEEVLQHLLGAEDEEPEEEPVEDEDS